MEDCLVTRRALIERAAAGGAALSLGGSALAAGAFAASNRSSRQVGLPTAVEVRADFQRMVDFGPRLTGSDPHNRYIDWLQREFVRAGCQLLPCDVYQTSRWLAESVGLDILEGSGAGPAKVASYFPRSQQTPADGVTGPLVYGGTMPTLSLNGDDVAALEAALQRYPSDVASWAMGISGSLGGSPQGSVMLVDLPMPPPLTQGVLASAVTYYNGQGETLADLATEDYKRLWTVPGLVLPLDSFTAMGVAGVVFIVDASYQALKGCYAPFEWFNEGVPALYVDRDTGDKLRTLASARPKTRLTLSATRVTVPTATVNAILPGQSSETIIVDSHTHGTGFVEENGGVALVHLARYFGSLPRAKRLRRTLVFAAWPGHFSKRPAAGRRVDQSPPGHRQPRRGGADDRTPRLHRVERLNRLGIPPHGARGAARRLGHSGQDVRPRPGHGDRTRPPPHRDPAPAGPIRRRRAVPNRGHPPDRRDRGLGVPPHCQPQPHQSRRRAACLAANAGSQRCLPRPHRQ